MPSAAFRSPSPGRRRRLPGALPGFPRLRSCWGERSSATNLAVRYPGSSGPALWDRRCGTGAVGPALWDRRCGTGTVGPALWDRRCGSRRRGGGGSRRGSGSCSGGEGQSRDQGVSSRASSSDMGMSPRWSELPASERWPTRRLRDRKSRQPVSIRGASLPMSSVLLGAAPHPGVRPLVDAVRGRRAGRSRASPGRSSQKAVRPVCCWCPCRRVSS